MADNTLDIFVIALHQINDRQRRMLRGGDFTNYEDCLFVPLVMLPVLLTAGCSLHSALAPHLFTVFTGRCSPFHWLCGGGGRGAREAGSAARGGGPAPHQRTGSTAACTAYAAARPATNTAFLSSLTVIRGETRAGKITSWSAFSS